MSGVKTPTVARKPLKIITPEQFEAIYAALPDPASQLLIETDIESGLRWGELTELRVKDLDPATRLLTVSRAVVQVNPKFHPDGLRFLVKPYPKDKEYRRFKLSQRLVGKLATHIKTHQLSGDDLLFTIQRQDSPPQLRAVPDLATLGLTEPSTTGRRYRHGTLTATQQAGAAASTAGLHTQPTEPAAARQARTSRGGRERRTPMAISRATGSA